MKVLAHPEDEACAAQVRRYLALAPVGDGVVLLVASADALADDAVLDEAVRAHRRGALRLLLWRACLVEEVAPESLKTRRGKVVAVGLGAPRFYPRSGEWLSSGGSLQSAAAEFVRDLILAGGGEDRDEEEGDGSRES